MSDRTESLNEKPIPVPTGDEKSHDGTYNEKSEPIIPPDGVLAKSTATSLGIQKIEILNATYQTFTLKAILLTTVLITSYAYAVEGTVKGRLEAYATSSFGKHSLLSTVGVVQAVAAAASQPTAARLSDRFGRFEIFIFAIVMYIVGTIVQAFSKNITTLSAGTVIYSIGYQCVIVIIQLILADLSNLNWRLFFSFVPALPFIINTWVAGDIVASLYPAHSWQYGYGIWAFIFPLSCVPLFACFIHMIVLARKTEDWKVLREKQRQIRKWKSISDNIVIDVFWEIDTIGILLIICGFGFFLTPFTIAAGIQDNWKKASTIAPLVIGFCFMIALAVWEAKFAKNPLLPFPLMKDRGVWAAIIVAIFINFLWYLPNEFIYTILVVGMNSSIKAATRITSLYSFVSVIVGPLLGLLITRVRRLKGFIIFGVLCWISSFAILYRYRGSGGSESESVINGVIGGLCFLGFGAGFFTYSTQVSIASVTNHEHMAIVISIYLASYNIGSAIGSAISGAVWTNTLYKNLVKQYTRAGLSTDLATAAYSDPFTFAVNYTWGTPERIPLVLAYGETQKILCACALGLSFFLLIDVMFLRDHRLDSVQSLEFEDERDMGVKKEVVVNDYDDDVILKKIKGIFKRN